MPIVPFDSSDRVLAQARAYISSPGLMIAEKERSVPLLLKALKISCDIDLRREIFFILGSFAKEELYWSLYEIMSDPDEPDELRDQAAVYLSIIGTFLDDPQALVRRLTADLESDEHDTRVRAIIALGWEGNITAVLPLIECIYDPDHEIQEVAVNALCNLKDSRVLRLLAERLQNCFLDQKRAILFNMWRFKDKQNEVAAIYREEIESGDTALRIDILTLLGQMNNQAEHVDLYNSLLYDPDDKVRAFALERLGNLQKLQARDVISFLDDPSMIVKRTAMKILQAENCQNGNNTLNH
ncbi:MAG: HEAT repeat domain-containing protein [Desulfobacteraceae bacterium]|nr:HEAT repeat domain-containing protein [Desulfobacteraceae bacterium]